MPVAPNTPTGIFVIVTPRVLDTLADGTIYRELWGGGILGRCLLWLFPESYQQFCPALYAQFAVQILSVKINA